MDIGFFSLLFILLGTYPFLGKIQVISSNQAKVSTEKTHEKGSDSLKNNAAI